MPGILVGRNAEGAIWTHPSEFDSLEEAQGKHPCEESAGIRGVAFIPIDSTHHAVMTFFNLFILAERDGPELDELLTALFEAGREYKAT